MLIKMMSTDDNIMIKYMMMINDKSKMNDVRLRVSQLKCLFFFYSYILFIQKQDKLKLNISFFCCSSVSWNDE